MTRFLEANDANHALTCYRAVLTRNEVLGLLRERVATLQRRLGNQPGRRPRQPARRRAAPARQQADLWMRSRTRRIPSQAFEKLPDLRAKLLFRIGRALALLGKPWEAARGLQRSAGGLQGPGGPRTGAVRRSAGVRRRRRVRRTRGKRAMRLPERLSRRARTPTPPVICSEPPRCRKTTPGRRRDTSGGCSPSNPTVRWRARCVSCSATRSSPNPSTTRRRRNTRRTWPSTRAAAPGGIVLPHRLGTAVRRATTTTRSSRSTTTCSATPAARSPPTRNTAGRCACSRRRKTTRRPTACRDWLKQYPQDPERGEVFSLLGDAQAAAGHPDEALDAYKQSYKAATTDEVLGYSILEAAKILQKRGDWPGIGKMFEEFVRDRPDHPMVATAMNWIVRVGRQARQDRRGQATPGHQHQAVPARCPPRRRRGSARPARRALRAPEAT